MRARLESEGEEVRRRERAAGRAGEAGAAEAVEAEEAARRAACEQRRTRGGSIFWGETGQSM
eukprot:3761016-Prymnesium_polylepis.2